MRTALACNVSPLFIRIALGITFLWAGASKVFYVDEFSGGAAAGLANAGVQSAIDAAQPIQAPPILPTPDPVPTPTPIPDPVDPRPVPQPAPANDASEDEEMAPEPTGSSAHHSTAPAVLPAAYFVQDDTEAPTPTTPPAAGTTPPVVNYTPGQFPEDKPVQLRRLNGLILAMDSAHQRGQWPDFLASPGAYSAMAWAAALTELFAGIFLLVGFLTRLAGLGVAGVMAGAIWMTQIGPNIGADDAFLGFLPALKLDEAGAWVAAWKDILWQFTLLMMGLAIFFSGPGKLAIDALLFSSGRDSRHDDED